ncbi:MAG: heme-binding protein, partial [Flavobacteriales bacterium]|nr:heme-binding protein [Flavobacteriales bacterium]
MKILTIILIILGVLFAVSQVWAQSQVKDIEQYPYKVTKKFQDFEIRHYEEANFIYATMDAQTYEQSSGKGFNILAGYIFGGNDTGQKIAMTSPVVMDMDERITMKFLIPAQY